MIKTAFFDASSTAKLQDKVNAWFEKNWKTGSTIVSMQHSCSISSIVAIGASILEVYSCMICYQE